MTTLIMIGYIHHSCSVRTVFRTNSLHTAQLIVASLRGRFWRTRNILMIMFCREMCVSSLKLFQHYTKRVVASKQITQVL